VLDHIDDVLPPGRDVNPHGIFFDAPALTDKRLCRR
jgi:hypothetical protein